MKHTFIAITVLLAGLLSLPLRADVLVLVHGYLGSAHSWRESGVTPVLERHGWQHAGVYVGSPAGIQLFPQPGREANNKYYAVDLPSEAPVLVQVYQLNTMLEKISDAHAGESIILVGHSAGGVVARTALVRGHHPDVAALISIASPHLGTSRAEQVLDATDIPFPLSLVTDFIGGDTYNTAMRSRSLYVDLVRPRPGTLLYWLNAQRHPDVEYYSVVRGVTEAGWGDYIVPAYSQDMNHIPALQGRSSLINVPGKHGLTPLDGSVIVNLVSDLS